MRQTAANFFLGVGGFLAFTLAISTPIQAQLNPIGNNGNVLNPGVPLTGRGAGGTGVVVGPGGVTRPATGPRGPARGAGSMGVNARPRPGVTGGAIFGGPVYVPYPVGGSGYTVHNPPPGEYDPIFGGYNPGVYPNYDQQAPTPTVIINQNFQPDVVRPQMLDYSNVRFPASGPVPSGIMQPPDNNASGGPSINGDTPMILIAMKDHTIYPALAYWVQGDTLNYVMVGGAVNHASISAVDRELSMKLNSERQVDFRLPPEK